MDALPVAQYILMALASAMSLLAVVTVATSLREPPRLLHISPPPEDEQILLAARKEAIDRSSHFEQLMVAIGGVELSILAYVAGFVVSTQTQLQHERHFFTLATVLFFVTTVAYLHTWKVYMAYGAYCVQLEIAGVGRGLRVTSQVFHLAQNPAIPPWIRPFVGAVSSIQAVALYPVFVLIAVIVGFGTRFQISGQVIAALSVLVLAWSVVYAVPTFVEFLKLVNCACHTTVASDNKKGSNLKQPGR